MASTNLDILTNIIKYDTSIQYYYEKNYLDKDKEKLSIETSIIISGFSYKYPISKYKYVYNKNQYLDKKLSDNKNIILFEISTNRYKVFIEFYDDYYEKQEQCIRNIIALCHNNYKIENKFDLCVIGTSNICIQKYIKPHNIIDPTELIGWYYDFRYNIAHISDFNINPVVNVKENLKARFHQTLIVKKIISEFDKKNKIIMIAAKCRSGKSYIIGLLIMDLRKILKKENINILIITPVPTETIDQFTDGLLHKYEEFEEFKIHLFNEGEDSIKSLELGDNNIFVVSKQYIQKYTKEQTINSIKQNLDIIFYDESHYSGTTDLSKSILDSYMTNNTHLVFLTATFNKVLRVVC
jgi:hypothetical protein